MSGSTTGGETASATSTLAGEWRSAPRLLRWIIVVQVVVVAAAGALIAYKYDPWSPIDEGAHYDYVQSIADDGHLPVLSPNRVIHDEVAALGAGTYPAPSKPLDDLAGRSYEAFQPPLYYVAVAPAWAATSNHAQKYKLVRVMGIGFLLLTAVVLAALSRVVVGREWPYALAFALLVLMTPGLLYRSALVGNAALEPLVGTACILAMLLAWKRVSYRWLALAAVVLGACLLTRLILGYLIPLFVVTAVGVWWRRGRRVPEAVLTAGIALVPLLMLAPWLAWNRSKYHAWTASALAREMQQGIINPNHKDYTIWRVIGDVPNLLNFEAAPEWQHYLEGRSLALFVFTGLRYLVVPLALLLLVVLGRRGMRGAGSVFCLVPFGLAVASLALSTAVSNWPQELSRYTYGALPAFAVGAYCVYRVLLPRDRDWTVLVTVLAVATTAALVVPLWTGLIDGGLVQP